MPDGEAVLGFLDPEVIWVQNPNAPDPRSLHGHDGFQELVTMVGESFEDVRLHVDEFIDARDDVVALGEMRARGKGSGIGVREERGWVWTVHDGKVVRHRTFATHREALEAVGLSG